MRLASATYLGHEAHHVLHRAALEEAKASQVPSRYEGHGGCAGWVGVDEQAD